MIIFLTVTIVALFGFMVSCLTSFAFVVGERPARGESIANNGSHCTNCQTPLRAIDNIPIFGWLLNKGKSHCCGSHIPSEYFWGELLTGIIGALLALQFFVEGVYSYEPDVGLSIGTAVMMLMTLAVWWRTRTIEKQYDDFNVYIEGDRKIDPLEEMVVNDPKTLYIQSKITKKKNSN